MNDSGFSDLIRDRRAQLVKEALHCREAGELLELARKYQLELSEEEARQLWQIIQGQIGELSDSELDAVTGGSQSDKADLCSVCWRFEVRPRYPSNPHYLICYNCGQEYQMTPTGLKKLLKVTPSP